MPDVDNTNDLYGITELQLSAMDVRRLEHELDAARQRRDRAIVASSDLKRKQQAEITGLTVARVQQIIDATRTD